VRPVGRRGLRGVGGVLVQTGFEFGDAGDESGDLGDESGDLVGEGGGDGFEGAEVGECGRGQRGEEFVGQRGRCHVTATLPAPPRERKGA
jgi:hypothetical protein